MIAAFALFVASLPFEAALMRASGDASISRLLSFAFFATAVLQPSVCFRRPPRAFWWFVIYFGLHVLSGLFQPSALWPEILRKNVRLIQFLLVLWVGYNLLQYQRVVRLFLWCFSLACVTVAGLLTVGIGATQLRHGRETVFGQQPNAAAGVIALGAVTLIGMAYGKASARRMTKVGAWGAFLIAALAITRTGSRGGLVGLGAGLLALLAVRGARIRNAVIVVLALTVCYWVTASFETTASRWQSTLQEGNTAGRVSIYLSAWKMFKEKPILGWGVATNYYELGRRFNVGTTDTHNLFLWLLTELGLVGAIPFCVGLAICVRAAWRGRKSIQGLLPLALTTAVLTVNLGGTYYQQKWFWIILAYSLASENYVRARRVRWAVRSAKRSDQFASASGAVARLRQTRAQ